MSEPIQSLPEPDLASTAQSEKVQQYIQDKILRTGPLPFDQFMHDALYAPGLGYYSAGAHKFGRGGDFVTAPELSPLFSRCLGNYCATYLSQHSGSILEFGAGTGVMAADILLHLASLNQLPERYCILEVSADLRARQAETLSKKAPEFVHIVHWLDALPEAFSGVVLANEVLDAMPVKKFKIHDHQVEEYYVDYQHACWQWHCQPAPKPLDDAVRALDILVVDQYESEINFNVRPWLQALSQCLIHGRVVLIDYGFLQHEYYHPERSMGTIKCHFRHHSHDDPLHYIGIQDITAHVDFTLVGDAAAECGFQVTSFSNQAQFLLQTGLIELLASQPQDLALNQQVKTLTMPQEMGEMFKVMVLEK